MYDSYSGSTTAGDAVLDVFGIVFAIALYLFYSYMQYRIASNKTGHADIAWWAFIPLANTFLLIKMAGKPGSWFFLLLIPLVNVVAFFILWINVAKVCDQSPVWGFLVMVPPISLLAIFVLAYGSRPYTYPASPATPTTPPSRPRTPQRLG